MLLLLCTAVYLPGQTSLPPVDRDECRFAQASRQMFESVALSESQRDPRMHSGGLVVPMLVDVPRLNKPPLVYWLQSASAALFTWGKPLNDAIWMYRVPSALCAIVAVFATWRLGLKMFDARAALLAAMLLAAAPMVVWDAHQARADQLLLACTTVCMGALWGVWKARGQGRGPRAEGPKTGQDDSAECGPVPMCDVALSRPSTRAQSPVSKGRRGDPSAFLFWLALGAGIMAKGPVTPLVAGLAILWLSITARSWRWVGSLRPVLGAFIVLACVAPWVWAVAQRQGGLGPYATLVWNEFFARGLRGSKEGHFAPPGTHTVLLAALFWPGSLLTLAGFIAAWKRARGVTNRDREGAAINAQAADALSAHERGASNAPPLRSGFIAAWKRARGVTNRDREGAAINAQAVDALSAHERAASTAPPSRSGFVAWLREPWHGRDAEMFLVAWIVPMWVVFELSMAKLPHYTMPMYPAIALVSARMVMRAGAPTRAMLRGAEGLGVAVWTAIGATVIGLLAFSHFSMRLGGGLDRNQPLVNVATDLSLVIALILSALFLAKAASRALRGRVIASQLLGVAAAALLAGMAGMQVLPRLVPGWMGRALCQVMREHNPAWQRPMASVYVEESMVFGTRGKMVAVGSGEVAGWSERNPTGLVVVRRGSGDAPPPPWRALPPGAWAHSGPTQRNPWVVVERAP